MRLSDAGLRQRQTKALYLNHRSTPWLTEDAPRDRSNRLLERIRSSMKLPQKRPSNCDQQRRCHQCYGGDASCGLPGCEFNVVTVPKWRVDPLPCAVRIQHEHHGEKSGSRKRDPKCRRKDQGYAQRDQACAERPDYSARRPDTTDAHVF